MNKAQILQYLNGHPQLQQYFSSLPFHPGLIEVPWIKNFLAISKIQLELSILIQKKLLCEDTHFINFQLNIYCRLYDIQKYLCKSIVAAQQAWLIKPLEYFALPELPYPLFLDGAILPQFQDRLDEHSLSQWVLELCGPVQENPFKSSLTPFAFFSGGSAHAYPAQYLQAQDGHAPQMMEY